MMLEDGQFYRGKLVGLLDKLRAGSFTVEILPRYSKRTDPVCVIYFV